MSSASTDLSQAIVSKSAPRPASAGDNVVGSPAARRPSPTPGHSRRYDDEFAGLAATGLKVHEAIFEFMTIDHGKVFDLRATGPPTAWACPSPTAVVPDLAHDAQGRAGSLRSRGGLALSRKCWASRWVRRSLAGGDCL